MNDEQINEMLGTNKPCPDLAKVVGNCIEDSIDHVKDTGEPTILPYSDGNLVVMTERAYKYMLSNCTEDELWDLGFLGASAKHAVSRSVEVLTPERAKALGDCVGKTNSVMEAWIEKHNQTDHGEAFKNFKL